MSRVGSQPGSSNTGNAPLETVPAPLELRPSVGLSLFWRTFFMLALLLFGSWLFYGWWSPTFLLMFIGLAGLGWHVLASAADYKTPSEEGTRVEEKERDMYQGRRVLYFTMQLLKF